MPGYEPRTLHAMALGLAVNARGADHNRSGAYEADLSGDLDRTDGGAAHVTAAIETEDRAAVMDSMILCKFLRGGHHRGGAPRRSRRGSRARRRGRRARPGDHSER
jgi:aldehyde:ferredoxin oxidoreductase